MNELSIPEDLAPEDDLSEAIQSLSILEKAIRERGQEFIDNLGRKALEGYTYDLESVKEYLDDQDEWTKIALQNKTKKNTPWPGASNVKHPLLTIASTMFGARALPAIVPGVNLVKSKISTLVPDGEAINNRGRRIVKYMDYQILEQMPDWEADMDRALSSLLPLNGAFFKKIYYDPDLESNVSEILSVHELIVDYDAVSLEKAHRKTQIMSLTGRQIQDRVNSGWYSNIDISLPEAGIEQNIRNEVFKQRPSVVNDATPHIILEQHTYADVDGDGYEEPIILTFLESTGSLLRIAAGFDELGVRIDDQGEVISIAQQQYFVGYGFIPNPVSRIYSLGFNSLCGPLVETLNTLINQLVDSGTMNTMQGGFLSKNFILKGGRIRLKPNEWIQVPVMGEDIAKGIFPMPTKPPSSVLFSLLGFISDVANNIASVKDILLGENPGQNQKATTSQIVLEQGLKSFTAIYKRVHGSVKKELAIHYRLNRIFLNEEHYAKVLGISTEEIAGKDDFRDDITIIPVSDVNIATDSQRLAKAKGLLELLAVGTVNPTEVTRRVLEAQNHPDIETLMAVPESQPSFDQQIKMQEIELEKAKLKGELELKVMELKIEAAIALGQEESRVRNDTLNAAIANADAIVTRIQMENNNISSHAEGNKST